MRITKVLAVLFTIFIMTITGCGGGGGGGGATTDITAPVVSAFTMLPKATSLTVAVTSFTASDAVGITGYLITESATAPAAGATGWSASAPTSFTFSAAGSKTAYAWAKDAAGNVSASRIAHVTTITAPISASMSTPIPGPAGVGTVTIAGMPAATSCGLAVQITYPSGVTFVDAIRSGITPIATSVTSGTIGLTGTEVVIAGTDSFGSGEVMKVNFSNVLAGSFGATLISAFDCFGVQIYP